MAITLTVATNDVADLTLESSTSALMSVGSTTVVSENDYDQLINHPSIEGTELVGDLTLSDISAYTKSEVDALLDEKSDKTETLNGAVNSEECLVFWHASDVI